jgi:hypothetical protein
MTPDQAAGSVREVLAITAEKMEERGDAGKG